MNDVYSSFLDSRTYEIIDDIIQVDKDICKTIQTLNKKGYKTIASCAGHNNLSVYDRQDCDISLLDGLDENASFKHSIVVDKTEESFGLINPRVRSQIYVMFDEDYNFSSLPTFFTYGDRLLESIINYYDNDEKISNQKLDEEIKKRNSLLLDWANSLPNNKERND